VAWLLAACAAAYVASCASTPPRPEPDAPLAGSDPVRFVAERTPWTFQGRTGWLMTTPSVELRTTVNDRRLLHRLPPFLELANAHRLNAITPLVRPAEPLQTYVLASRTEWDALTRQLLRDQARPYLRIERGGYAVNGMGIFYDLGPRDTFVMAAHEGWHQHIQTSFADPLPVWLDEGIACYLEGFRWRESEPDVPEFLPWLNPQRFDQLRSAAANGTLIPLADLVNNRPQDLLDTDRGGAAALNYYAQCWALVHFFMESDAGARRPGLERLLRDAQSGRFAEHIAASAGEREAVLLRTRRVGGGALAGYWPEESVESMDAAYRAFVGRIVRTGGRDRALMGRSPITP
tara:strand:- start:312 stop:1355 length:1044 start_codon:yes stop_codon:yes gene_type:complete